MIRFEYLEDNTSYEECVNALKKFLNSLKMSLKRKNIDFYYLGVPEYQRNGNIHYHFLISDIPSSYFYEIPKWLDFDYTTKQFKNDVGLKLWKYGKSTVEVIQSKSRVSSYISEYINKDTELKK